MGDNSANFVVCLRLVRVVDETGEDYLYPDELFASVEVTREIATALS